MASTFFGLNIAYTGLTAANAALNTTANNISNTNTDGYSRQLVNQKAANSIRTYTTYGCSYKPVWKRCPLSVKEMPL